MRYPAELLERSAALHADRPAVETSSGDRETYAGLRARAERWTEALREIGVGPGDRVGVAAPKSIDVVAAIFGVAGTGAAYVPLDPEAPAPRNAVIIRDCGLATLIAGRDGGAAILAEVPEGVPADGFRPEADAVGLWPLPALVTPRAKDDLACILYTSGSTGRPKGVMISDANVRAFVRWGSETFRPGPDDRFSSHAPFHFDLSVFDLFVSLANGATVVLIEEELARSPHALAAFVGDRGITVWYSTPTVLTVLARFGEIDSHPAPALRLVLFAGEVFPLEHLRSVRHAWPAARYFNLYGPTETNVCTFFELPPEIPPGRERPFPIGKGCSHARVKVVADPDHPDAAGELLVSGESVTPGYWNRPELEGSAFSRDEEGRRWYATGDLVQTDRNGDLVFVGRRDRMVKRRGYRIEPDEIEIALRRHPAVAEAAAVARSDGDGETLIEAFVAWGDRSAPPSGIELRRFLAGQLPRYMVPDRFRFVEALPMTSTHKVDYQRLKGDPSRRRAPLA